MPKTNRSSQVFTAMAPIYLLQAPGHCYRCDALADVSCLAITGIGECQAFMRTKNLSFVPRGIDVLLKNFAPDFYFDKSKNLYLNHCPECGAIIPDEMLHALPDDPFVPANEDQAESITMRILSSSTDTQIASDYTASWCDEIILEYALRLPLALQGRPSFC